MASLETLRARRQWWFRGFGLALAAVLTAMLAGRADRFVMGALILVLVHWSVRANIMMFSRCPGCARFFFLRPLEPTPWPRRECLHCGQSLDQDADGEEATRPRRKQASRGTLLAAAVLAPGVPLLLGWLAGSMRPGDVFEQPVANGYVRASLTLSALSILLAWLWVLAPGGAERVAHEISAPGGPGASARRVRMWATAVLLAAAFLLAHRLA